MRFSFRDIPWFAIWFLFIRTGWFCEFGAIKWSEFGFVGLLGMAASSNHVLSLLLVIYIAQIPKIPFGSSEISWGAIFPRIWKSSHSLPHKQSKGDFIDCSQFDPLSAQYPILRIWWYCSGTQNQFDAWEVFTIPVIGNRGRIEWHLDSLRSNNLNWCPGFEWIWRVIVSCLFLTCLMREHLECNQWRIHRSKHHFVQCKFQMAIMSGHLVFANDESLDFSKSTPLVTSSISKVPEQEIRIDAVMLRMFPWFISTLPPIPNRFRKLNFPLQDPRQCALLAVNWGIDEF